MSTDLIRSLLAERSFEMEMERKRARRILERVRHDITQLLGPEHAQAERPIRPHEIRPLVQAMTEACEAVSGIEAISRSLDVIKRQLDKHDAGHGS